MAKLAYMCDFETTTDPSDCRVWAACAVEIDSGNVAHLSNSIDAFMAWLEETNGKYYFHNLRFDGEFILSWLLRKGYRHVTNESKATPEGCFQTLINDMGIWYKLVICFKRSKRKLIKVEIFDSVKKIPFPVRKIAKDYGLPMAKGSIDYTLPRPEGWEITPEEREYIETDCRIVQQALLYQLNEGMTRITIAADALKYYKETMAGRFDYFFPVLPKSLDDDLRRAYKGGYTWCNPRYAGKVVDRGIILDVNSLYPSVMRYELLPIGYPIYFEGKYEPDELFPLYICRIRTSFTLKSGHIPCVQIKNSYFSETEYLTSSTVKIDGHNEMIEVELTMTNVDLELFLDHYDVHTIEYRFGFKFRAMHGLFDEYIDTWMRVKETAPAHSAQRAIAKLYLNSLYGKFARSTEQLDSVPYMSPDGVVRYYKRYEPQRDRFGQLMFDDRGYLIYARGEDGLKIPRDPEIIDPIYTPVGCFITAWARNKTIRSAQRVYDRFIYADTDSLHLVGTEIPEGLEIHPTKLGAWDHEATFTRAKYLRAKTYLDEIDGKLKLTCAGYSQPESGHGIERFEDFYVGRVLKGKKLPRRVPGGVVLEDVDFEIRG